MAGEFANIVNAGGYGKVIDLPANCQASFAYIRNGGCLHLLLVLEEK